MKHDFDAIIVGGGPAGLSAALVLGRCRRRVVVFDDENPRNARSHGVHGFLSREGISPWDLRAEGRAQLAPFDVELRDERVVEVRLVDGAREGRKATTAAFELVTATGAVVRGRKLVLATGMRDEVPRLEGIDPLLGGSVHFCPYCHGWEVRNQRLAAYAKCPKATDTVDFALGLTTWSKDVVLFTDGLEPKLGADDLRRLERNEVRVCEQPIARLEPNDAGSLARVVLQGGEVIERDAMFVHAGRSQRSELPEKLGVAMAPDGTAETGTCECTNVPGVWVIGDASRDVQFAIVAAAEGAKAAFAINRELREEQCR